MSPISSKPPERAIFAADGRILGVEYDSKRALVTVIRPNGAPLHAEEKPVRGRSRDVLLKDLEEVLRDALRQTKDRGGPLLGIGVASPGLIDPVAGVCRTYTLVPGFQDVPLRDRLAKTFGVPVVVDHDVVALTTAEKECGAARGVPDFICLIVRAGVGLGMVAAGRVVRGATNNAGEFGLTAVGLPGSAHPARFQEGACEDRLLEAAAALLKKKKAPALARHVHQDGEGPTPDQILRAAHEKDAAVRKAVHDWGRGLGWGIGNLVNLLNPRTVVLHGRFFADRDEALFPAIEEGLRETALPKLLEIVNLFPSPLGLYGGALGGALMARDRLAAGPAKPEENAVGPPVA